MPLLLLLLLLLLLPIFITSFLLLKPRQTPKHPPGPTGLPFIGNLHQADISRPHILLANYSKQYGPVTFYKLCRQHVVVFSSADAAKNIYKWNDAAFAGRPHTSASLRLSYGQSDIITATYSDYWRRMRKMVVHHLFAPAKIRSYRAARQDEVSRMCAEVSRRAGSGQRVDVGEMALAFSCNLLYRVAFGKKWDESVRSFDGLVNRFWGCITESFVSNCFLYDWISKACGVDRRVEKVFEEMESFYHRLIDEHLSPGRPESMNGDILDLLIQLREDESAPVKIDWKHVKAILMNISLGGTGTSGVTIVWALTALAKKPSVMKKVQQEIRSSVGIGKYSLDENDIEKLPYLKAVINETLRLYPPVPLVPKENTERCIVNGYEIEAKTFVLVNIWAIHRDPEYWEDPEEFLPERFLNKSIDYKGQDFGFIPFGSGRRICPRMHLAIASVSLALANLLYLFNWEIPPGMTQEDIDVEPVIGLVMQKKNPLYLVPKTYV